MTFAAVRRAAVVSFAIFGLLGTVRVQASAHGPPAGLTCPGDVVVWVNTRSGIYHFRGERYFGATKEGRFMCERAARAAGDRPTRNGQ